MKQCLRTINLMLLAGILFSTRAFSQQANWTDTLNTILNAQMNDSIKISELVSKAIFLTTNAKKENKDYLRAMEKLMVGKNNPYLLAQLYYTKTIVKNFNIPEAELFGYIDSCLLYAEKVNFKPYIIRGYRIKGQYQERKGLFELASINLEKAIQKCKELNDPFETYRTLLALSSLNENTGDLKKSIEYSLLAADVALKNNLKTTLGTVYLRIAKGYAKIGDHENAQKYIKITQDYCTEVQQALLPEALSFTGTYFQTFNNNESALKAYLKCDSVMQAQENYNEAISVYTNLASIYTLYNKLDTAQYFFTKSVTAAEQKNHKYLGRIYTNYSTFLNKTGKDSLALEYANKAISEVKSKNDFEGLPEALQAKAECLIRLEDYDSGFEVFRSVISVKDSLNTISNQASIAELMTKYETEQKEDEIQKLNSEKKIQQLQLEKQKALLAGNALLAKQKQQEIDLLNQNRQIQELKLSQQKESLALKQMEVETNQRKLELSEKEKQLNEAELNHQIFSKNLILIGSVILLAFVLLVFNQYRINTHRKNDKEKFQLQNQLSEMRLEALRAQMNPHFIFNALNSINRYIIRNSKETASEYLIKFSKLMRIILENSKSPTVTLESEFHALQLYVELEALRFDNKFDFKLNISPEINQGQVSIPPLILQPFVENAIWHGLMNKNERGSINIEVKPKSGNKLFVVIEDNGIGRNSANEYNKNSHNGKSFGMQITQDRLNAFNNKENNLKIVDLYDANNKPAGTRVEIEINTIAA